MSEFKIFSLYKISNCQVNANVILNINIIRIQILALMSKANKIFQFCLAYQLQQQRKQTWIKQRDLYNA